MTQITTPSPSPALGQLSEDAARTPRQAATGRLVGVDLARGLAVFGMFAAHVGPDPSRGGVTGYLMELCYGRSSALFAVLAGVTLVIIAGRRTPRTGRDGRQACGKIVIRSLILLALGTALSMTGTSIDVILAYYGLCFLLALPFARLRANTLAAVAAVWALAGPQLLYAIQTQLHGSGWAQTIAAHDPVARLSGEDGVLELLFTGDYPALAWMPFVLAGMALGRLDLASAAVRIRLAVLGPALALLGYGGSWLAFRLFPGIVASTGAPQAWWSDTGGSPTGNTPAWLLVAAPHSETTLSILGNTGVAVTVVVAALAAMDHCPRLRRFAAPVIAVGSMSLTAYVLHIAAIGALGTEELPDNSALPVLLAFIVTVMVLAFTWSRFFQRGPLEHLLAGATKLARHIR
jgi:uncharacterized membrane protein YeiB